MKLCNGYFVWLLGVIIWNFGIPEANPMEDVIMAILLGYLMQGFKKNENTIG